MTGDAAGSGFTGPASDERASMQTSVVHIARHSIIEAKWIKTAMFAPQELTCTSSVFHFLDNGIKSLARDPVDGFGLVFQRLSTQSMRECNSNIAESSIMDA